MQEGVAGLQQLLKEEYVMTVSESEQKNYMQKRLNTYIVTYHNNYIQLLQQREAAKSDVEKKILKDEGFSDAYTFIKESIMTVCKDFRVVRQIVRKNDDFWDDRWVQLSKTIVNTLYENLAQEQIWNKDIMFLMVDLVDIIMSRHSKAADVNFTKKTVSGKILKEFTQREEVKRYCQNVLRSTMLAIAKVDHVLDFDNPTKSRLREKQQTKDGSMVKSAQNGTTFQTLNYTVLYSEIFRQYDIRKNWAEKDSNYMSRQLLDYLGVSEETSFTTFTAHRRNVQNDVNMKFNKILDVINTFPIRDSRLTDELEDVICKVRNIVNTFFGSIFKNLYNMPSCMRVLCKAIQILLRKRFPHTPRSTVLRVVGSFLFSTWLLPELHYQDKALASGLVGQEDNRNASQIQQVIMRVVQADYYKNDVIYYRSGNDIIKTLHGSVENYLEEILNTSNQQVLKLIDKQRDERICSFSACMSFEEMRNLFQMILDAREELQPINDKLVNRVTRVRDMTDGFEVLKGRQDKEDGKFYTSHQAYVLFSQLNLPTHLQADYYKQYVETYKNDKAKNLLRQVLVGMDRLQPTFSLRQTLQKLVSKFQFVKELNSVDRTPIELKIRYLLTAHKEDLEPVAKELLEDYRTRISTTLKTFDQTKAQFLKAKDNIKKYQNEVIELQKKHALLKRKKAVSDFIDQVKISICLTSPKSREGEIAVRAANVKNMPNLDKDRIWLELQSGCIHTTVNLQFIKSLTGDVDKKKKDEVGHCNSIRKFVDTFSSLPELRSALLTGEDRIGIKSTFYDFLRHCIELARNESNQYRQLLADEQWFQDQLERQLTWRLYEKIYPKSQTYQDAAAFFRMKTLDWVRFQHLNIKECNRVDRLWRVASRQLLEMDQFKTPSEKLQCIINCTQLMSNILTITADKDEAASADTTYPIMVYILLKACPRRLLSNLNFIELFSNSNKMMSEMGYCFIQIKSAIAYFEILNETKMFGVSKMEYERKIYEKEAEYGVYFLKRRPRYEKKQLDMESVKSLIALYTK